MTPETEALARRAETVHSESVVISENLRELVDRSHDLRSEQSELRAELKDQNYALAQLCRAIRTARTAPDCR